MKERAPVTARGVCVCGWVYTYIQGEREVALHAFVSNTKSLMDIVDNVTPIVEHQRERILLSVSVCCCALVCVLNIHTVIDMRLKMSSYATKSVVPLQFSESGQGR